MYFNEIWYWISLKFGDQFQFWLKSDSNNGFLYEDLTRILKRILYSSQ